MAKSTYNEAQWRWIADRYEEGYPLSVIASTLYMAKSTVEYHFLKMGVIATWSRRGPELPLSDRLHELRALADTPLAKVKSTVELLAESEAARADLGQRLAAAQQELQAAKVEICKRCNALPCRRDGCRWWRGGWQA